MFSPGHVSSELSKVKSRLRAQPQAIAISADSASLRAGLVAYGLLGMVVLLLYATV